MFNVQRGSAAERIVEAALDLFGRQGVAATSVRAVAEQAGVSAGLVIHHFSSKEGLREACDDRVVALIHSTKLEAIEAGPNLLPGELQMLMRQSRPAMRYLTRTLGEGSPRVNELVDDLIEKAIVQTAEAEQAGLVRPSTDPRSRTTVLTLWMLGALVLHQHVHRLLGVDLLDENSDVLPYMAPAIEVLQDGLLTDGAYPDLRHPTADTDPEEKTS